MSASLVGSEMCIRDRRVARGDDFTFACYGEDLYWARCAKSLGGGEGGDCLLYTSPSPRD
eukprot:14945317-Alexandrium_andersonii.AAC.1